MQLPVSRSAFFPLNLHFCHLLCFSPSPFLLCPFSCLYLLLLTILCISLCLPPFVSFPHSLPLPLPSVASSLSLSRSVSPALCLSFCLWRFPASPLSVSPSLSQHLCLSTFRLSLSASPDSLLTSSSCLSSTFLSHFVSPSVSFSLVSPLFVFLHFVSPLSLPALSVLPYHITLCLSLLTSPQSPPSPLTSPLLSTPYNLGKTSLIQTWIIVIG